MSSEEKAEPSYVDEREDVQKKTFAKWVNSQLAKNGQRQVCDLVEELRDGELLLALLEVLTAQQYKRERGRMRVHHINNVNTALRALADAGVRLVNISSGDVVDGNPKLILGLVWSIILHWQVHLQLRDLMTQLQQTNLEKTLLAWCRQNTQNYAGVDVTNFSSSWSDGLAFNALLHRWRPELFPWAELAARPAPARLTHAFQLASEHLGIDPLLDPEDVNTAHPDKKSIMMYVMCLFQSLPHSPSSLAVEPPGGEREEAPPSRPLSTATSASAELGGYGAALEEALAWLLAWEERLAAAPPPPLDLPKLKETFHDHEQFLLELSSHQSRVGAVLEEGARLLAGGGLSREEAAEVRLQLRLLAARWESLRRAAMERQALVHRALMAAQLQRLQTFRQWLTETEDQISRMGPLCGGRARLEAQLRSVEGLQRRLTQQQPRVDELADCVLVVDDDHDTGATELEDALRALGERWSNTCQWTQQQLGRLRALQARWAALGRAAEAARSCSSRLKALEGSGLEDSGVGAALARVQELGDVARGLREARRAARKLQREGEGEEGEGEWRAALEAVMDECDAAQEILSVQADRLRELGFEVDLCSAAGDGSDDFTNMDVDAAADNTHETDSLR